MMEKHRAVELSLMILSLILAVGIFFSASGGISITITSPKGDEGLKLANGVLIFLSLVTIFVQALVILDFFKRFKLLRIKVPCRNSLWYLSSIIKYLFSGVCSNAYAGIAFYLVAQAVAIRHILLGTILEDQDSLSSIYVSSILTAVFCLSCAMVSIAITAFILLAKWKYKFPEYDPTAESADLDSEQAPVITESET